MIQPAMHACRVHSWQTLAVVLAAAVALLLPGFVVFSAAAARDTAEGWLASFNPVIYLSAGATHAQTEALRIEMTEWSAVEHVRVRKGADAVKDLETRLGAERVRELGVTASMMPSSFVLVPSSPVTGHIELVSVVSGLEARDIVDSVSVPDASAVRILSVLSLLGFIGSLLGVLGMAVFTVVIAEYLIRLQDAEQAQNDVLLMFGAQGRSLRKPSIVRGVILGLWSGGLATITLMVALAIWQSVMSAVLGGSASLVHAWPVAVMPLAFGPVIGVLAGFWVSAPERRSTDLVPRLLTAYGV